MLRTTTAAFRSLTSYRQGTRRFHRTATSGVHLPPWSRCTYESPVCRCQDCIVIHFRSAQKEYPQTTNSPCRIGGLFSVLLARELDAIEVLDNGLIEVHRVALIEGVDLASLWDLDVRVSQDELPESRVQCITIYTITGGQHQVCR